jgi:hypothetical protein
MDRGSSLRSLPAGLFSDRSTLARQRARPLFFSPVGRAKPAAQLQTGEETMNEQEFQQRLGELISQINEGPETDKDSLVRIAEETKSRHDKMKRTIADLQESLDYLRLSVKYLVFDLEATRRENQYLRKLLDRHNNQNQGHDEQDSE